MIKRIAKIIGSSAFIACSLFSQAQSFSPYIVVDQFGYLPDANKVAVIRDPQTGIDAASSFTPTVNNYALVNATTSAAVFTGGLTAWNGGATDASSGDKAWWFDFTSYNTPGKYYVKDVTLNVRSAEFVIADTVYKSVLKAAMRMLYYQRSSFAKVTPYAGVGWTDAASHLGAGQDNHARVYNQKTNATTEKDLHGGWYDAGDLNKYTAWTASYVITLLSAYEENPTVFTDDFNIPESGNGVPDILDEIKWGIEHLQRMQQTNGSCISVLGSASASPPSAATGSSYYGLPSTNATLKCAAAFAYASKVYKKYNSTLYATFCSTLETNAIAAWTWADANQSVQFYNNDEAQQPGSGNLAAGQQETNDLGRKTSKLGAALYLYDLTGQTTYLNYFETNYVDMPLVAWYGGLSQYFLESQSLQMYYLSLSGISSTVANNIRSKTLLALSNNTGDFKDALINQNDPYRSFIKDYNWGPNQYKSNYGNLFWELNAYEIDNASNNELYLKASEEYLHYIHGVNPLQFVYLTNMASYGAEKSANEMYHTWFGDGTAKWDRVGTSTYGPPPGFLMGGANKYYGLDACCTSSCSGNSLCNTAAVTPPIGQPQQKSYKDFNTSWPQNSWQLTETSLGYQTAYIRLLSKFVNNGSITTGVFSPQTTVGTKVKPNPTQDQLTIEFPSTLSTSDEIQVEFYNVVGNIVLSKKILNNSNISIGALENGVYILKVSQGGLVYTERVIKIQ